MPILRVHVHSSRVDFWRRRVALMSACVARELMSAYLDGFADSLCQFIDRDILH